MTNNPKDDMNTVNSQHINEVGGLEDTLNKMKNPGTANATLAGQNGLIGGHDAVQNDLVRYIDWINGKGDYGTAGRDHSFGLSSLAIVNPYAAGAIVGAIAIGAAIHGIATSTFVRTMQAKRRLNYIYNQVISKNGYNPSGYYVALFGTSLFKSKDKTGELSYGPKPFRKYYDKIMREFASTIDKSKILDANGKYDKSKRDKNEEESYATASGFIASSIRQFYMPDNIVMQQKTVYKSLQSNMSNRFTGNKEYGNLLNIINDATQRTNSSPIYLYVEEQLKSIKEIGDGICEGFDKKMSRALANGKYRQAQSSKGLKALWEKQMKEIRAKYEAEVRDIIKSELYKKIRIRVESLSKVSKESEIINSLSESLNVDGVFGRKTNDGYQLWKVVDNNQYHNRSANIVPVNIVHLMGLGGARQILKSDLFDRAKFVHFIEKEASGGSVKVGHIYKMGITALAASNMNGMNIFPFNDDTYVYIDAVTPGRSVNTNRTHTNNVTMIVYHLINFYPSLQIPQVAYVGGTLPETEFMNAILCEMVIDNTEMNNPEGRLEVQSEKESAEIEFNTQSKLNEADDDSSGNDQNNTNASGEDTDEGGESEDTSVEPYKDVDMADFADYVYVLPGRYRFDAVEGEGNGLIVTVKQPLGGKVEYYDGDRKIGPISLKKWSEKKPFQIPSIPSNDELIVNPGPPRDIPDQAGNHKYPTPTFPLTYGDFYKDFLHTICDYKPILDLHKDKLQEYGLYVKNGKIEGIYTREDVGADADFSMHIPYNFTPYIRSLGGIVLFEKEEDYNNFKPKTETHESLSVVFDGRSVLNESALNESSYDGKSIKVVKKTILDSIQRKWVSIFTTKYDLEKQKEIVGDTSSNRDELLKEIDKETLNKIVEEYKVNVLTKVVRDAIGKKRFDSFVERLEYIAKQGPDYVNVDRKPTVNFDTIEKDKFIGSTYGRIQKNVENVPDFDKTAQQLAEFQKEIRDIYTKELSAEERKKAKASSEEAVEKKEQNQNTDSSTTTDNSTNTTVSGDGNDTNVVNNNGDGDVNIGNTTIVNNINGMGDMEAFIQALALNFSDIFGKDADEVDDIDDGEDNTDTPVDNPKIVKTEDNDLRNIILLTCAHIISVRTNAAKEEQRAEDSVTVAAIKAKKPEYYTFSKEKKDDILTNGDESKISVNSDESKKLGQDVKEKYIVNDGRIFSKIVDYDPREDVFTFLTEEGEYSIKGTDTISELDFEVAQQETDDVVNEIIEEADLPTIGTVFDIQEDVFRELIATPNDSSVNDSAIAAYNAMMKLYEDGDENSVKYVRVMVGLINLKKGIYLTDAQGNNHLVSIDRLKEYGVDKFNKACRSVSYAKSGELSRNAKYIVDKDYYNNVIVEKAYTLSSEVKLEKTEDERIIKVTYIDDKNYGIHFKIVTTDRKLSEATNFLSYLYLDISKLTKTDKDPQEDTDNSVDYKKDELYVITNYDEVKDDIIEHSNESSQEYAYYKLYHMHLNEDDGKKTVVMKIVNVEGDNVTFALSTDEYNKTYTFKKSDMIKFKLEKYEQSDDNESTFNPDEYEEWDSQVPYPLEDLQNLAKLIEGYKKDPEKKKLLTQLVNKNREKIVNSGISGANEDEIIDEFIATAHKFSDDTKIAQGEKYNMLYITPSSSMTNSPILSSVVRCDKTTDAASYFSVEGAKDKFFISNDKTKAVHLYPFEEKKNIEESVGVTINEWNYTLYKLYGGSILEAVNINPANPSMMSRLVNILLLVYKALTENTNQQTDQQNQQQNQQQEQQPANQNQNQQNPQEINTTVGGGVPFTITSGKPVETVDSQNNQ